jgi:hypothetical protein
MLVTLSNRTVITIRNWLAEKETFFSRRTMRCKHHPIAGFPHCREKNPPWLNGTCTSRWQPNQ